VTSDAWQPIEGYAIIGDCRTAALISRDGSIAWLCLPDYSSPSIFGQILDRWMGGLFLIRPSDVFTAERRYLDETPILETIFGTARGTVRVTDVVPVVDGVDTIQPMREILRFVEGIDGEIDLEIRIDPRPNYGRTKPIIRHHGQLGWCYSWSNELLMIRSDINLEKIGDALHALVRVRAGDRMCLSLPYVKGDLGVLSPPGRGTARTHKADSPGNGRCAAKYFDSCYGGLPVDRDARCTFMMSDISKLIRSSPTMSGPT
jgi:hypothetical protein